MQGHNGMSFARKPPGAVRTGGLSVFLTARLCSGKIDSVRVMAVTGAAARFALESPVEPCIRAKASRLPRS